MAYILVSLPADCEAPPYSNTTYELIAGTQGTRYMSNYTVSCKDGYSFLQEEFSKNTSESHCSIRANRTTADHSE